MVNILTNSQGKAYLSNGNALVSNGEGPVISSLNVIPTTSTQIITAPVGTVGYSPVNVAAVTSSIDSNISASNIKKDVVILGVTGTYEGSGGGGKYHILDRIIDDNNNEIGTVSGFYKDDNNINYAVVCLDAQHRLASGQCLSSRTSITDLPQYGSVATGAQWGYNCQSSTYNTQKILDYCTANNYTSSACTHCRNKSFTIDGTTYYGQLPNIKELSDIITMRNSLELLDSSAVSAGTTLNFSTWKNTFTSTQYNSTYMWISLATGYNLYLTYGWKDDSNFIIPVLEIPLD